MTDKNEILKKMRFNENVGNGKHINIFNLKSNAGWKFQQVNHCLRIAMYGRNV
jgi:hypothetical protein